MRGRSLWCGEVCISLRHLIKYSCSCKTIASRCLTSDLIRQLVRHLSWFCFRVYVDRWLLRILKEWPNSRLFERSKANCGRCCSLSAISSVAVAVPTVTAAAYAVNAAAPAAAYAAPAAVYAVNAAAYAVNAAAYAVNAAGSLRRRR